METVDKVDNFYSVGRIFLIDSASAFPEREDSLSTGLKKISTFFCRGSSRKNVDMVDNYFCRRDSPIFTTSPAPIVINRSPFMQFSNRNFSASSKVGK